MLPRRSRGRKGATEPEDQVNRIERILEGLVQVVHNFHNNNNHDDAPKQPAVSMPRAGAMPRHQVRDCPVRNKIQGARTSASASVQQPLTGRRNNQPRQGRAFALVPGNIPVTNSVVSVSFPSGDSMLCDRVDNLCEIRVNDVPMYVDLIPLEMHGFDVILGMDWLSSYRALIDCELKRVAFHSFTHSGLIFEGVEDIHVVQEFLDVLPDELPGSLVD
ncbi:hypothetical protein Acr_07g0010520 [Actinidia rufa]|uniref:Reverse transcriptase domain-containing protein n=1 Tax=Actinidia rufa TaxID=165716 RepID=A0A7J0EXC9_9ERIC|nr:hypothetical protein Acr_07g0010520 [Actinidia rufa]